MSATPLSVASSKMPDFVPPPFDGDEPPLLTPATIRLWKAFAALSPERRRWALSVGRVEVVTAGQTCRAVGEIAFVVSGCLALEAEGSDLAADLLGAGDLVTSGAPRTVVGHWISDGELYRVSTDAWLAKAGIDGMAHLLAASDARRAMLERRLHCATVHRATARLADLFLTIHEATGQSDIALSQARLATMLGLRRTTVNGSSRALEQAGGLRTRRGHIRIRDVSSLTAAACGCRRAGGGNRSAAS